MTNHGWKDLFPIEDGVTYLNTASIGLMPKTAVSLAHQLIDRKAGAPSKYFNIKTLSSDFERLAGIVSQLFHCQPSEVAFPFNTAGGIASVTTGIDWMENDVILVNDQEFPTNFYPYQVVSRKFKVKIRTIRAVNGRLTPELFEDQMDEHVKMIALSYVQFGTGYRADLKRIAKLVHENDGYLLVDGIQGLGALDLDVKKTDVDFVSSGAYKWLTGPFGTGVFYCKKDHLEMLNPLTVGWISDEEFSNMDYHEFVPARSARRFQSSTMPPLAIMGESIKVLTSIGISEIERHVMAVTDYLIKRVQEEFSQQVSIVSSLDKNERSGILVFDVPNAVDLVQALERENIFVALRKGKVRVSVHLYNDLEDVNRFLEVLNNHLERKAA